MEKKRSPVTWACGTNGHEHETFNEALECEAVTLRAEVAVLREQAAAAHEAGRAAMREEAAGVCEAKAEVRRREGISGGSIERDCAAAIRAIPVRTP